jgi:crotonobetainyl-CoA:carnitine CoA-transferase CaiB-like acyl-CoA transferase
VDAHGTATPHLLDGVRVIEWADERAEYVGMVLAGLGAEVIKLEPIGGSPTRRIGPFLEDRPGPDRSLYFWQYNRGKRSIALDPRSNADREQLEELLRDADVLLTSETARDLSGAGWGDARLRASFPRLVVARVTPFGDEGPWADYVGSDLIHLALGGQVMNCGYDPRPDGEYDLPPIAPQMWHAYHVTGENMLMAILGALFRRERAGTGQILSGAIHEALSKNTEIDLMNWVMLRSPVRRQTCRHAVDSVSLSPTIQQTKDGRWFMTHPTGRTGGPALRGFLDSFGMASDLDEAEEEVAHAGRVIPGSSPVDDVLAHTLALVERVVRKHTYADYPWRDAQDAGIMVAPLRRPEENMDDPHWRVRGTYAEVAHPELGRSFTYVASKWVSSETSWATGRRAPLVDEDRHAILAESAARTAARDVTALVVAPSQPERRGPASRHGRAFALDGVRVLDFGWFLASAGGTRFLAALGAECLKVEWAANPDTRIGAMAPVGGRAARRAATGPLEGVLDPDMGGQFNNKNAGKRGISLNVRHPEGLAIARRLVAGSDIVAEGFSPGVLDRWGLGYDELRAIKPDIIYAQQSGMGALGTYGRFRAIGPIAGSLSGLSEMSGLPEPAMPAGWGYSYLDWIGAYSFASAMLAALYYRERTGMGQRIDASQTETGLFVGGTAVLDRSANGRGWTRYGNRSPYKPAAPHGIYPSSGGDAWIAIACFDERHWRELIAEAGEPEWAHDLRFATLELRLGAQDALDAAIGGWTNGRDRYELMDALQARGVPAGVCQTAEDRVETDPQLRELAWLTELPGTRIGTWPVADFSVRMSETPADIGGPVGRAAPIYGEDNEYVYGELLGYSTADIARLAEDGVI